MRILLPSFALAVGIFMLSSAAQAHCQIPCGIYDDHARVHEMREHVTTIEKSVKMLADLAGKGDVQSVQQQVRWVTNKEAHAEKVIRIISDYFLTQRVKPASGKENAAYLKSLSNHHAVMVAAMKTKQNANQAAVDALRKAVDALESYYPRK